MLRGRDSYKGYMQVWSQGRIPKVELKDKALQQNSVAKKKKKSPKNFLTTNCGERRNAGCIISRLAG